MNDTDVIITDADYEIVARYSDAVQHLRSLEYRVSSIKLEAQRKVEAMRTSIEQAKRRVRNLTPAYQASCARCRVDPVSGEDIENDEYEEEGA